MIDMSAFFEGNIYEYRRVVFVRGDNMKTK